jgi:hypothetical protein
MERARKPAALVLLAVVSVVVAMLGGCIVPSNAYLMELNRKGKWREAERVGQGMLEHRSTFTHSQICETYFNVIYAQTRMGKKDEAAQLMKQYDAFSAGDTVDPSLLWLGPEMTMLKDELGLLDEAPHTLLTAMEENGKGNYARARELCDAVLAMNGASDVQKATAHFVAAVCSIRLKDVGNAEAHLKAFDALKSALPPDHQSLLEEPAVRRGLLELKKPTLE